MLRVGATSHLISCNDRRMGCVDDRINPREQDPFQIKSILLDMFCLKGLLHSRNQCHRVNLAIVSIARQ